MGGLVAKKVILLRIQLRTQSFINACNSLIYKALVPNIKAMVFFGTPHRGAEKAELLSRILGVTLSQKIFVQQLRRNSESIQEINNLFRDNSLSVSLISYYEQGGMTGFGVYDTHRYNSLVDHCSDRICDIGLPRRKMCAVEWKSCGNHAIS